MVTFISCLIIGLTILVSIPIVLLCIEVVAAIVLTGRGHRSYRTDKKRPRIAVLVPAHNESTKLLPTLNDIKADLYPGDRLVVVADNCVDDTATVAKAAGAEVAVRNDYERIGKGYALDWGLRYLRADPPEILIVIDADCRISRGAIGLLANTCMTTGRPTQALYLMTAPDESPINYQVAEFAWRVKNWVRPLGLSALNLPCQLMGTGMAFPFDVICSAELASGQIVEDLKLGLDLAQLRTPPCFCPMAVVTSQFPTSVAAADSQRQRWEHGHMGTIVTMVPRLACLAILSRNWPLLVLTLDVAVPPLAFLAMVTTATFAVAALGALFGYSFAGLMVSLCSLTVFSIAIVLSWWKYGRDLLPPSKIGLLGPYVFGKLPLYRRFLMREANPRWVRTERKETETRLHK
jgi:cellulose synthase/poly-beta-1,6-N-acetylglucosamine synthase-like glycosyltransferase